MPITFEIYRNFLRAELTSIEVSVNPRWKCIRCIAWLLVCCRLLFGCVALLPSNIFGIINYSSWRLVGLGLFGRSQSQAFQRPDAQSAVSAASKQAIFNHLHSSHHRCTRFSVRRNVRRILVRGSMPPCCLRRRKFWKFDYEMVHSEVYLNK